MITNLNFKVQKKGEWEKLIEKLACWKKLFLFRKRFGVFHTSIAEVPQ
jgi:hypothetical protein